MSTQRSRRIDRDTAEQLLGGAEAGTAVGHDALAGLLAAAAAPAAGGELSGEQAALAAFRTARLAPVPPSRKRSMPTSALARLLSAKVVAAVLASALGGGVAVAAATGRLPAALGGGPARSGPVPGATAGAGAHGAPPRATATASPAAVPADLAELCRALDQSNVLGSSSVLSEPRYAHLVAAAGGEAGVPGYCAPVLADQGNGHGNSSTARSAGGRPSTAPTHPDTPGAGHRPSSPAAGHSAAVQRGHPTSPPTAGPSPSRKSASSAHATG
jgi:hypothetical protein